MKNKYLILSLFALLFSFNIFAQSNVAENMSPFCAGGSTLTFDNTVNGGNADPNSAADSYGCLGSEPNPAWFFMQISQGGDLEFFLSQENEAGNGIDVDFILWGPFAGPPPIFGPANLNDETEVDCSFSAAPTESVSIPDAQPGQYYVILITNYSNQPGQISLTQTNIGEAGAGTTNCDIVCPLSLGEDFVLCPNETAVISATIEDATSYEWFIGDDPIPGASSQDYTVTGPGVYSVVVNKPGCVADATASVTVTEPDPMPLGDPNDLIVCAVGEPPYIFDLTENTSVVLNGLDPDYFPVSYHTTEFDADEGFPLGANPSAYPSEGGQTIYVRVEDFNTGCYETRTFQLIANEAPVANTPPALEGCDEDDDRYVEFDLTQQNGTVLVGQNPDDFIVTYHTTAQGAEDNDTSITTPEAFNGTSQPIYVRVTNVDDEECYGTTSFELIVTIRPVIEPLAPVEICDEVNNDNQATFDLAETIQEITNDEPALDLAITLHASQADAEAGAAPLDIPVYTSDSEAQVQTVYFRVEEAGTTNEDCFTVVPLELHVYPTPEVGPIEDYELCDQEGADGIETFDLTTKTEEITDSVTALTPPYTAADLTVTYYETEEAAEDGGTPIADPTAYTNTTPEEQEVWFRVETAQGCVVVSSFSLVVNPLPALVPDLEPFYACEEVPGQGEFNLAEITPVVTGGAGGYDVSYYSSEAGAEIGGNHPDLLPMVYTSGDTVIWVRAEDQQTGCAIVTDLQLLVIPGPVAENPDPLEECDWNLDGHAIFNIDPVLAQITAALGGNVELTVFETIEDAENDAQNNAIQNTSDYTNLPDLENGVQTLYIRVQSTQTECFDIVELQLIVRPVPQATEPEPYGLCDNGASDTDGAGIFDLTTRTTEILGALNPGDYTVTYHITEGNAAAGTPVINNPTAYQSASTTVWARVTDNATDCYDIVPVELIVNPLPQATAPEPYSLCDVNNPGDEREVFDLTSRTQEIIGTQEGIILTFHHSLEEAHANEFPVENPEEYENQATVETLFVRVTIEATGCYRIVLLDVRVEPLPQLSMPSEEDRSVCDDNDDGIGTFNLEALIEDMIDNGEDLQVTFHWTAEEAALGLNPIENTTNFTNTNAHQQDIYVRVVNLVTGCFDPTQFVLTLIVQPSPQLPALEDLELCDEDSNNQDFTTRFDLTEQDAVIEEALGLTPGEYDIHYFTSLERAEAGTPRITNPTTYPGTNGQTIWVRVENELGCYGIGSFELIVNRPLLLTQPETIRECNSELPNDMTEEFDLTIRENDILGPLGIGLEYTFTYYEQDPRVNPTATPIANPEQYNNPPAQNPKTLYVMVTSPEGCRSYITLTVKVLPLPTPNTDPEPLVLCDDNGDNDLAEEFDLTLAAGDIRDGDATALLTYYETLEDAENATNPIPDPTAHESASGIVYVRVEANTGDDNDPKCYQIVELELIVNPLPGVPLDQDGYLPPFTHCEQNTDGFHTFILSEHNQAILGEDANPEDYTIRYYRDAAALNNGTALDDENGYTNEVAGEQDILVWIRHDETGCITTAPVKLLVEEQAIANPVTTQFYECDYDGNNDGVNTFDLTQAAADVLGTQDPLIHSITYYESEADAIAGTNAIADPENYTNTNSPGAATIWVRIVNTDTVSGCPDFTSFEVMVEQIPEPVLAGGTICVDFTTGEVVRDHELNTGLDDTHTFVWYKDGVVIPGATGPVYAATATGSYTVIATSATGCVSNPIAPVTVLQSGPASPIGTGYVISNAFSEEQVITVNVEGHGIYEYRLDEGPWQSSNVFTNAAPGPHRITVRDTATDNPCDDTVIEGVSIIDYPRFFTPNGDGYNDTWNVIGLQDQPEAKVYIFDRYGKLVKQISTQGEGWDGTMNGSHLTATDYWFTVTYRETVNGTEVIREFKSHFSLKR